MAESPVVVEPLHRSELVRSHELLTEYVDNHLDFADASIVAIAERLGVRRILTTDRRHFSVLRPAHCEYFEILP